MIQQPINLRGPAINLRDDIGDCAGGRPVWRKDLRVDLRGPARSNRHTHPRTRARTCDPAIKTIAQVCAGARGSNGSFPARFWAATGRASLGGGRTGAAGRTGVRLGGPLNTGGGGSPLGPTPVVKDDRAGSAATRRGAAEVAVPIMEIEQ